VWCSPLKMNSGRPANAFDASRYALVYCRMRSALSTSMPLTIDWAALDARGSRLSVETVSRALRELYGLAGQLVPLARERDDVYRLDSPTEESRVVRVSPATEPAASLALQNSALHAIAREDPSLPVPRIIASAAGNDVETIDDEALYRLRVLSFLPGTPVFRTPRSVEMLRSIGRTLARMDAALANIAAVGNEFPLLWDVRTAPQLRSLVRFVGNTRDCAVADRVFAELDTEGMARLSGLPTQVIHNDFNPKNVLFDSLEGARVVGIIDFGDVVHAARIVDLGVTIARHLEPDDPMRAPPQIVAGYCDVVHLSHEELRMLPLIARTRLAMRAVIGSWRRSQDESRGDPIQIQGALALLDTLSRVATEDTARQWGAIVGL
jgi:hydroxylysine kinase